MARTALRSSLNDLGLSRPLRDSAFAVFRHALDAYLAGESELPPARVELIRCVAESHDRAVSMLHYLRTANEAGLVADATMHVLVTDIQFAVAAADRRAEQRISTEPGDRTLLAGRYEIRAPVAKGGIGEVFLAKDRQRVEAGLADTRVAIKIIQTCHGECQEAIRSLQREAVNAQCLVHPGIRRVYEMDRDKQRFFLVMEWLDGETLASRLDRTKGRPMAPDAFRAVLSQAGAALSFAHQHGIVHGDIKPGNVFLTVRGNVKLLDFGHTEGISSRDSSVPFALTRGYSSLDVHAGAQPEIKDDVYALAVMAYRMLVGRRPFGRHTAVEVEALGLRPRRPSMLGPRQWRILHAGLALHREDRLDSVSLLCDGLLRSPFDRRTRPRLVDAA